MSKKVIITGVSGMDGSLMADFLLKNTDYKILGGVRRLSVKNYKNIEHIKDDRFELVNFECNDPVSIETTIKREKPDYFINFAANSFVTNSWEMPVQHLRTNAETLIYVLEAIRKYCPKCRLYNAGSSEEWGNVDYTPQDENHRPKPRSIYGVSKVCARMILKVYRESYNLYAIQGWLANHEGVRRGEEFITRKITKGVAKIYHELKNNLPVTPIIVGNLQSLRDWSDSEDFVDGIWKMLNQEIYNPALMKGLNGGFNGDLSNNDAWNWLVSHIKEYVLASGECHSVLEFIHKSFEVAGIKIKDINLERLEPSENNNGNQINFVLEENPEIPVVCVNRKFYRPCEVNLLQGSAKLAINELGWEPKTNFPKLVAKMVKNDIENP